MHGSPSLQAWCPCLACPEMRIFGKILDETSVRKITTILVQSQIVGLQDGVDLDDSIGCYRIGNYVTTERSNGMPLTIFQPVLQ